MVNSKEERKFIVREKSCCLKASILNFLQPGKIFYNSKMKNLTILVAYFFFTTY